MGLDRLELPHKTAEKQHISNGAAQITARLDGASSNEHAPEPDPVPPPATPSDPDLARLIRAWPTLPEAVRAGIRAMVAAAAPEGGHDAP